MRAHILAQRFLFCAVLVIALSGCQSATGAQATATSPATLAPAATPIADLSPSPEPSVTATEMPIPTAVPPTLTATIPATPEPTATPDPYAGLTIDDLTARTYGAGALAIEETLAVTDAFTRTLITYPSDGLTIYGFMNVPAGSGPFPVVIVLHGYIDPDLYQTLAYTTRYADHLARAGYLVIHPNLRGYPPSDDGPNRFRVGMAVDVLNLIGLVQKHGGQEGPLAQANPAAIGLMGHSMGGGITLRVITVSQAVGAAVVYGSMSADERTNQEQIVIWSGGTRGREELETPEADLRRISPSTYLERIEAPVSIHHSLDDATVPPEWSAELAGWLEELDKEVEHYTYTGTPHTFRGEADRLFMERMTAFFDRNLR
ncbi:MAG: alpha/beta hydrolase family protein [Anaerolineae bacterium]